MVSKWLANRLEEGVKHHEIGIFVRSVAQLDRARATAEAVDLPYQVLDDQVETITGQAAIGTMHLAKGLEFRVVVVMACDDEILPLQERIEMVTDDSDLEEVYNTAVPDIEELMKQHRKYDRKHIIRKRETQAKALQYL